MARARVMFHLFHLGPLVLGERSLWLISAVNEQGGFIHPLLEREPATGVGALVARYGPQNLRAEPALAQVAASFGVHCAPLPLQAHQARAVQGFAFASSHRMFRTPSVVASFLEACAFFGQAAPWTRVTSSQPFRLGLTTGCPAGRARREGRERSGFTDSAQRGLPLRRGAEVQELSRRSEYERCRALGPLMSCARAVAATP